jgi:hypothetical protein
MTRCQRILTVIVRDRKLLAEAQRKLPEIWTRTNLAATLHLSYRKTCVHLAEWAFIGIVEGKYRRGGSEQFRFIISDLHTLDQKPLHDILQLGAQAKE